jgi:DNA-binding transcriptional ArsR family regulator
VPVKHLVGRFQISQPAISQHLAKLREAGLVSERRQGRLVYYHVEREGLSPLTGWLAKYRAFWPNRVNRLQKLLEKLEE